LDPLTMKQLALSILVKSCSISISL